MSQAEMIADAKVSMEGGERKLEPNIGALNTGFTLQARPTVSEDHTRIGLELKATTCEKTGLSRVPRIEGVPIEMPKIAMRQFQSSLEAPRGAGMLAVAVKVERSVLLMVKADLVESSTR